MGYQKYIAEGNLTQPITVRYTQSGSPIASTTLAVNRKYKTQQGEQREEVLFIDLSIFGRLAEIANQYLNKGSHILIDGRLKLDQWTAQDGTKRQKIGVVVENLQMLGSKSSMPNANAGGNNNPQQPQSQYQGDYNQDNSGGNQPPQNNQAPQHNQAPQQEMKKEESLPEIDINEDSIPF